MVGIILEALYILEGLGDESVVFGTERYETELSVELLKVDMASHRRFLYDNMIGGFSKFWYGQSPRQRVSSGVA